MNSERELCQQTLSGLKGTQKRDVYDKDAEVTESNVFF